MGLWGGLELIFSPIIISSIIYLKKQHFVQISIFFQFFS